MSSHHMTAEQARLYAQQQDAAELRRLATPPMLEYPKSLHMDDIPDRGPRLMLDGVTHGAECDKTMYGTLAAANVLCTCDSPTERRKTEQNLAAAMARRESAMVDGLMPHQCLTLWKQNRVAIEALRPPLHVLTPAQFDVGRKLFLERGGGGGGPLNKCVLRAMVVASDAARKAREPSVVIEHDAEDLPWRTW